MCRLMPTMERRTLPQFGHRHVYITFTEFWKGRRGHWDVFLSRPHSPSPSDSSCPGTAPRKRLGKRFLGLENLSRGSGGLELGCGAQASSGGQRRSRTGARDGHGRGGRAPGNIGRGRSSRGKPGPGSTQDLGPCMRAPRSRSHRTTHLSFAWSWFIQQESVWIGVKSIISVGRPKGVPQIPGAGLGAGRRRGGQAAAHAPVATAGTAPAVGHVAALLPALLPRVTGSAGSWPRQHAGRSPAAPRASGAARYARVRRGPGSQTMTS